MHDTHRIIVALKLLCVIVVVLKPGTDEDSIVSELHSLIKDKVASYKQLRGGIIVIDEIPKTSSGKILRR